MRYQDLRENLKAFSVFTLGDIRKIEADFYRPRLNEWQKKGFIKKLRRGYYIFADAQLDEQALFLIANRLYAPSYVSLEAALSYYGLIPEGVYSITSVACKKTAEFKTPIAVFSYCKIKPEFFFGYSLKKYQGQSYKMAEIEKAVLDYLYFNPNFAQKDYFYESRFNSEEFFAQADLPKLNKYAGAFNNKLFSGRLGKLISLIKKSK